MVGLFNNVTVVKLSRVRLKRKGQVTIPLELRSRLGLEEGAILEMKDEDGVILIIPAPPIEPGKVVGEEEYKKILAELEARRRNWR